MGNAAYGIRLLSAQDVFVSSLHTVNINLTIKPRGIPGTKLKKDEL